METSPEGNMAPRGGWFSRNWKWAVPVGCLGIIASCICVGAIAGYMGFNAVKNNAAYLQALTIAMGDDEVQATLGTPIDPGTFPQESSVKYDNGRGTARFAMPLKGSKVEGVLRVEAIKTGNEWEYQVLQVDVPGREPIDLKHKVGGAPPDRQMAPPTPDTPPQPGNNQEVLPEDIQDEAQGEGEAQGGDGDTPT
ncbi:MAG TPA: cytochrome c oxidase assembly factor Coa1 family protein [Hyalangium sp.]|nr:cytochrome c oxidase assembly factor Coa1 family protein [Hyalangium sp.]